MNRWLTISIFVFSILNASLSFGENLRSWVDENGVKNIANEPGNKKKYINRNIKKPSQLELYGLVLIPALKHSWGGDNPFKDFNNTTESVVLMDITKDGFIKHIEFEKESGNKNFDILVLKTIIKTIPLPPLPKGHESHKIGLTFFPDGFGLQTYEILKQSSYEQ